MPMDEEGGPAHHLHGGCDVGGKSVAESIGRDNTSANSG